MGANASFVVHEDDYSGTATWRAAKVGWIDEAKGLAKMRGVAGPRSIVHLVKPDPAYFLRGGRRTSLKIPSVFEHGLFMAFSPSVPWELKGGPNDVACVKCFKSFKSQK
jgi:hypothetical protein